MFEFISQLRVHFVFWTFVTREFPRIKIIVSKNVSNWNTAGAKFQPTMVVTALCGGSVEQHHV